MRGNFSYEYSLLNHKKNTVSPLLFDSEVKGKTMHNIAFLKSVFWLFYSMNEVGYHPFKYARCLLLPYGLSRNNKDGSC